MYRDFYCEEDEARTVQHQSHLTRHGKVYSAVLSDVKDDKEMGFHVAVRASSKRQQIARTRSAWQP